MMSERAKVADAEDDVELVLRNASVLTLDAQEPFLADVDVCIAQGVIVGIATSSPRRAAKELDCSGLVVMPGFVDAHTHHFQILGRGLGDGLGLGDWLSQYMFPYASNISSEEAVAATRLASLLAILGGTTSAINNHYAPTDSDTTLRIAEAMESVGLSGAVARGVFGDRTPAGERMGVPPALTRYSARDELRITEECLSERPAGRFVEIWPTPENLTYVAPDLIVAMADVAGRHGVHWHSHCSEAQFEVDLFEEYVGVRPITWLSDVGILTPAATLAHAIWVDDDEIELLGTSGASVIHNPISNQYVASGVIRLRDLIDAGVNVALGTDGTAVSGQHMFEAMKAAQLLQRIPQDDAGATTPELMIQLACRNGGRLAGHGAGVVEVGATADLAVLDLTGIRHQPLNYVSASIAQSGGPADVRHTIVRGQVVVESGVATLVDHDEVVARAVEAARGLATRAGFADLRAGGWSPLPTHI